MRLIFHIGAGKTGTSSIQQALQANDDLLRQRGVWYLGLALEHAVHLHGWQRPAGEGAFSALPREEGEQQLRQVLQATLRKAQEQGLHTLVWSNEAFFDRHDNTFGPLQELCSEGVDVQVLAWVRCHEDWAQSAYIQWGINHKTYQGPLRSFRDYTRIRPPVFATTLRTFADKLPGRLQVRNFDAATDAVSDFCLAAGLEPLPVSEGRHNVTGGNAELLMRAVLNNSVPDPVLPMWFDRLIGQHVGFGQDPQQYMARLLPTAADLEQVGQLCAADFAAVNALLVGQGQQPLAAQGHAPRSPQVDEHQLLLALVQLTAILARRVETLDTRLKALKEQQTQAG
jgi:hypothetical protein